MKTRFLVLIGFLLLTAGCNAEGLDTIFNFIRKAPIILELESENGGILKQRDAVQTTFKDAYYSGVNFKIGWKQVDKHKKYNQLYNFPIYGLGFSSSTFNSSVIGSPFAIFGFVQVPIAPKEHSRWAYDYRIGLGLSGNFNPYQEDENPLNVLIGSKNNVFINFGLRAQYRLSQRWMVGAGLAFHHFSNGALALPNKGINVVPTTLSINYKINPDRFDTQRDSVIAPFPTSWRYDLSISAGAKQMSDESGMHMFKSTGSFYLSRFIAHKWILGAGADVFYSGTNHELPDFNKDKISLKDRISGGPAIYIAHVLTERLLLNGNVGYYIHKQYFNGEDNRIFLRAGARYYVYKNLNTGVSIKAHKGKADYVEWTVGYTFNRK